VAIEIGSVLAVFGVRGELRVHLDNPRSDLWKAPVEVTAAWPDGSTREVVLAVRRGAGKRWLGRIEGVSDRDAAQGWVGVRFLFPEDRLPAPGPDEAYVFRIEGAPVEIGGLRVGRVSRIHSAGGADVLEIRTEDGRTEFVPCIDQQVERIDGTVPVVVLRTGALAGTTEE
jgi:16S rRNA processing protein RimM